MTNSLSEPHSTAKSRLMLSRENVPACTTGTRLAAASSFLLAAKRTADLRPAGPRVHVRNGVGTELATGNTLPVSPDEGGSPPVTFDVRAVGDRVIDALFDATIEATEEAIANCLVAAETMVGRDGITAHALPHDRFHRQHPLGRQQGIEQRSPDAVLGRIDLEGNQRPVFAQGGGEQPAVA